VAVAAVAEEEAANDLLGPSEIKARHSAGVTHYNLFSAPALASSVIPFLDEAATAGR
jgi:hypothetical protein